MDNIETIRTNSKNADFAHLIALLDKSLWESYPQKDNNYWGNNIIEFNQNVILIYRQNKPVACGCFKKYDADTIEIKRMFVAPEARGLGLAKKVLQQLELWANEQAYSFSVLETLYKQKAAISLYQKVGYEITANYEPYLNSKNSICMKKNILGS
jgi:GNAT superfamily N-acetyltransferase